MTTFRYEAARPDGATVRGVIEAASGSEAAAVLSARGLFPVGVRAVERGAAWSWRRPSARSQATVFQGLASLVDASVPLAAALQATERVAPGRLREAIVRVRDRVTEGMSFGAALAAEHRAFSPITIGLVRAGERGVGLAPALAQAAAELEARAETEARIRAALTYPALLALVGAGSVLFIVAVVVPRFVTVLGDLGGALPVATRLLLGVSDVLRDYGVLLALPVGVGLIVAAKLARERRVAWHEWLLRLQLVGSVRHALATARVSRTLSALLATGTPALTALAVAQEAAGDAAVAARLARAREQVAQGVGLAAALAATAALTPSTLQLAALGEQAGRLPALLAKAAALEASDAERRLKTLVSVLEPALIVAFAGVVAFVAAALLQAMYSIAPGMR